MYYIVYKTTNQINGKYYIGKHQTSNLNDGYIGSGKLLQRAIKKYGYQNFITDILEVYDQEWKMNLAERILVLPDKGTNYNLCVGGKGGFGYINNHSNAHLWHAQNAAKGGPKTEEGKQRQLEGTKHGGRKIVELGKLGIGIHVFRTHCKYGHEFTVGNTFVRNNGRRLCIICKRNRDKILAKKYRKQKKELHYITRV